MPKTNVKSILTLTIYGPSVYTGRQSDNDFNRTVVEWVLDFNAEGYLAPGLHRLELDAIDANFVTAFPNSNTRRPVFAGYLRHRLEIATLGITCVQFLNGSFVSTKNDPGDVDLVGFSDLSEVDALDPVDQQKFKALFSGKATKATHSCDAYFVPTVPDDHPLFNKLRSQRKYWMGEFGYDREDRPKGIISTVVTPAPQDGAGDNDA